LSITFSRKIKIFLAFSKNYLYNRICGGDKMSINKVGNSIKEARKAKGLTQKDLAKLLECSHTTISKYEQGEIENMPRPRMQKMADILEVSPVILFNFADEQPKQPVQDELSEVKRALIDLVEELSESEAAVLLASLKSGLGR
jgi:transcriptional regulator with XRE-family HTH domain